MRVAIDDISLVETIKNTIGDNAEIIYVFNDTNFQEAMLSYPASCVHVNYINFVDINLSRYNIMCKKHAKITDKDWADIEEKNYKIGIIIPNCNYEEWIEKCLNSIATQSYKNYEVIFVDDVSNDDSVKIAKSFKDKMNIKIIELKQKRFNGGARNEAYLHLSKDVDYIWYVDSDDWIKEDALEDINNILQSKPDVVFIGMSYSKNGVEYLYDIPDYKNKYEAFEGWSGSCGKIIKKELATRQECLYNEGTLKEDKNQHRKICFYMNNFVLLKKVLYVWNRDNKKSVTTIRDKAIWGTSTIRHYADAKQFYLTIKGQDPEIDALMEKRLEMAKKEILKKGDRQF